jgi:hypothetical protein
MDTVVLDFHGTHRLLGDRLYLQGASFCFKDLSLAASSLAKAEASVDLADHEATSSARGNPSIACSASCHGSR